MNRFNQNTSLPNITGGAGINVNQVGNNYRISSTATGGGSSIDDAKTELTSTWSSTKISTYVPTVVSDKLQNQTAISGTTTFSGIVNSGSINSTGLSTSSGFKTPTGLVSELLTASGSVNNRFTKYCYFE